MQVPFHKSIASRLFALICLVLLITLTANAWQFSSLFYTQLMTEVQEKTLRSAKDTALTAETILGSMVGQMKVVTNGIRNIDTKRYQIYVESFIRSNDDFINFGLIQTGNGAVNVLNQAQNPNQSDPRYLDKSYAKTQSALSSAITEWAGSMAQTSDLNPRFKNLSSAVDLPVLGIAVPFKLDKNQGILWATLVIWQTKIYSSLTERKNAVSYLIDKSGKLITANDLKQITANKPPRLPDVFKEVTNSQVPSAFKEWKDSSGIRLSAFARIPQLNLIAYAETDGTIAYAAVQKIIVRTALWGFFLLLIAIAFSYFASSGITDNLKKLTDATLRIAAGNFKLFVPIKSTDEVGLLGQAVNHLSLQIGELLDQKVENVRIESELATAKIVQESFFPKEHVIDRFFAIYSHFEPATECGGDWWSHYHISDSLHLIVIADATGHGVPAALVTAMTYAAATLTTSVLKRGGHDNFTPDTLLEELNEILWQAGHGKLTMTCLTILLDLEKGEIAVANAGHNFPVIIPSNKDDHRIKRGNKAQKRIVLNVPGSPLGHAKDSTFGSRIVKVSAGDKLLLFTDGIFECSNPQGTQWGMKNFMKIAENSSTESGEAMSRSILDASKAHRATRKPDDDITFVLLEISKAWLKKDGIPDEENRVKLDFDFSA